MKKFTRSRPTRSPRRRFLIVCEGEKSEPNYIIGVQRVLKNQLIDVIILDRSGATKYVVERAVAEKRKAKQNARRSTDKFELFDEIWCVFDVDSHERLEEAMKQAKDNEISVSLSNPCYELWVVLHHRDERKFVDRKILQSECKQEYQCKDKHIGFEKLWPNYTVARDRARSLRKWQLENQRENQNPWTTFDLLVESLIAGSN